MRSILELFTQDTDAISKVFPITFYRSTKLWFHSLKPDFIPNLHDLYIELISNLAQEFLPEKVSQNSLQLHSEKMKVLRYISKGSIKKC
jgi:uncharacterized protein (DUF2461 family)